MLRSAATACGTLRRAVCRRLASSSAETSEEPWKNPWKHAIPEQGVLLLKISHSAEKTFTDYEELKVDWKVVENLLPKEIIPDIPNHSSYPTPSGWRPQRGLISSLSIARRDHVLPLYLERKRDLLNEQTLDFDFVELVVLRNVEGDVFACEADLRKYLENALGHPVATHVDELKVSY